MDEHGSLVFFDFYDGVRPGKSNFLGSFPAHLVVSIPIQQGWSNTWLSFLLDFRPFRCLDPTSKVEPRSFPRGLVGRALDIASWWTLEVTTKWLGRCKEMDLYGFVLILHQQDVQYGIVYCTIAVTLVQQFHMYHYVMTRICSLTNVRPVGELHLETYDSCSF